MVVWHC